MNYGKIIIINGTSSAGKTSIVGALQQILREPYLEAGIDRFIDMLPKQYLMEPLWQDVFIQTSLGDTNRDGPTIRPGPIGNRVISGMHHAIAALAKSGNHVIADHVLLEELWLNECVNLFREIPTFLIGAKCPLGIAEQREMARKDRVPGTARAMFPIVHSHCSYDLEIDTSIFSPVECAQQIAKRLLEPPKVFNRFA